MRLALVALALLVLTLPVAAQEPVTVEVDGIKVTFTPPADWKKVPPASRIVAAEYKIDPIEGEETAGRLTMMGAGGSIEENIKRWYNQFEQPGGKTTADVAKQQKISVGDTEIHIVDISGTFDDRPGGQFAPGVKRPNHRMLAAIVVSKEAGNYFFKFHAPAGTAEKNRDAFKKMIESVKVSK